MTDRSHLRHHAERLRALHRDGLLVLPNAWDAASASLVVEAGFPVVATASNAVAAMLGVPDGGGAPPAEMFAAAARVAAAVDVPVTMDAEAGYDLPAAELVDRLLGAGAVGCNLEDTDHRTGRLRPVAEQAAWLAEVRAAAAAAGVAVVVNARTDAFLPGRGVDPAAALDEALVRARAYAEAGADCVYPIGVGDPSVLGRLVTGSPLPVNGNPGPALGLADLAALGVRRASYGPQLYRAALETVRERLAAIAAEHPRED